MGPLIKITTEPLQMVRFTQNARLVTSDSVDIERRKALARQMSSRRSNPHVQGSVSVEDITRINRAFSRSNATPQVQVQDKSFLQTALQHAAQPSAPAASSPAPAVPAANGESSYAPIAALSASTAVSQDISVETSTSYTAQRGAFEMRVAKGDLTYFPPLVMTIITQRPQVHVEYLGGFNYVPPRDGDPGRNVNLFT